MRHLIFVSVACLLFGLCAVAQQNSNSGQTEAIQPARADASVPAQTSAAVENEADPLLDLPPLPKAEVSLVGGTVAGIDRVRDRITVRAFRGKKMKFDFDERTHIYRDGVETTQLGIHKGDRVYVDSQLVGSRLFARSIRIRSAAGSADAEGQIEAYDPNRGTMLVRDTLSSEAVIFHVTPKTMVRGKANSVRELQRGELVKVNFAPGSGERGTAKEIVVIARPGEAFEFAGRVTYLNLSSGSLALQNHTDDKNYEISFDPSNVTLGNIGVGSEIKVSALFDGSGYTANQITVQPTKDAKK
jgi:Domain of unknown function (DUF5666)